MKTHPCCSSSLSPVTGSRANPRVIRSGPNALPNSAVEWFTLLHAHPILGFTLLNGFDMMTFVLAAVVYFAVYSALKRTDREFMILVLALSLAGIALYIASNPAFSMLRPRSEYAAASTDALPSILVAGEQIMASKNPFAIGQNLAFVLFNGGGLILSTAVLRSGIFSTRTAWLEILSIRLHSGIHSELPLPPGIGSFLAVLGSSRSFSGCFWYIGIAQAQCAWKAAAGSESRTSPAGPRDPDAQDCDCLSERSSGHEHHYSRSHVALAIRWQRLHGDVAAHPAGDRRWC